MCVLFVSICYSFLLNNQFQSSFARFKTHKYTKIWHRSKIIFVSPIILFVSAIFVYFLFNYFIICTTSRTKTQQTGRIFFRGIAIVLHWFGLMRTKYFNWNSSELKFYSSYSVRFIFRKLILYTMFCDFQYYPLRTHGYSWE